MVKRLAGLSVLFAALTAAACTVQQSETPPLTGPSTYALSVRVTATPDTISQDGRSQSAIVVTAQDANGKNAAGVPVRIDMTTGGVVQDFGTLSARNIVTASDGRAVAVYTAPPAPPPAAGSSGALVTIVARPTGFDARSDAVATADIRLMPPGVILPPAGTPTATFTISPSTPAVNTTVNFNASGSLPGSGASSITSYAWTFGDGSTGSGSTVTHSYTSPGAYSVTLTVTNDRGLSASSTQTITVGTLTAPTSKFVFSPTAPKVGTVVQFNASASAAVAGHTIVSYTWDFGDASAASGMTTSHSFTSAGTFVVTLVVTDDTGQTGSFSLPVQVSP